jgi:O-Antigen ligase
MTEQGPSPSWVNEHHEKTESASRMPGFSRKITFYGVLFLVGCLLLGRGLYAVGLVAILLGITGQAWFEGNLHLPRSIRVLLVLGVVLFLQGIAVAPIAYGTSPYPLLWCLVTVVGVWQLREPISGQVMRPRLVELMLVLFVFANLTSDILRAHWPPPPWYGKSGLFSNVHYQAMYSVMTLPIGVYVVFNSRVFMMRLMMALTLIGNLWLLLETRSRPGYLALLCSAWVVIPFLKSRLRWKVIILTVSVPAILYLGNIANFSTRVDEFLAHFAQEERWTIWTEAIRLQKRSTEIQWLLGHGFGAFYHDFRAFALSQKEMSTFLSQHNFFMEILYSHGVLGLLVVTLSYGSFIYRLAQVTWLDDCPYSRQIGLLLLSVATAQLVHGFSTVPFFSRDYLLPLGFVLGAGFLYAEKSDQAV